MLWLAFCSAGGLEAQAVGPDQAAGEWVTTLREMVDTGRPDVRGEAALALAKLGDPADAPRVLAVAEDRDPAAHIPATIGLGYLASPAIEVKLGRMFDSKEARLEGQRLAAAVALGLLPRGHPAPRRAEFLANVPGGSYAQNEARLTAWLIGVVLASDPAERTMVRFLVDEVANKRNRLRMLALHALQRFHEHLDLDQLVEMRCDDDARIRSAAMRLTPPGSLRDAATQRQVTRAAESDPSAEVRIAALDLLTRERSIAALERAGDAVESDHALEAATAVRTILTFGGHILRRALERRVLERDLDDQPRTAMLRAWSGKPSEKFTEDLLRIAADPRRPTELACAAAAVAASAKDPRVTPILRRLLRRAERPEDLARIAHGLHELGETSLFLKLEEEDATSLGDRLVTLLKQNANAGLVALRAAIEAGALDPNERARCINTWHTSLARRIPPGLVELVPPKLRRSFLH